jgi:hypothetical protein
VFSTLKVIACVHMWGGGGQDRFVGSSPSHQLAIPLPLPPPANIDDSMAYLTAARMIKKIARKMSMNLEPKTVAFITGQSGVINLNIVVRK